MNEELKYIRQQAMDGTNNDEEIKELNGVKIINNSTKSRLAA